MVDDHGCNAAVDKATNSEICMAKDTRHSSHKKGKSKSINTRISSVIKESQAPKTPKLVSQKYLCGLSQTKLTNKVEFILKPLSEMYVHFCLNTF